MIILNVEDYCLECPDFEADINSSVIRRPDDTVYKCTHNIYCKHDDKCKSMMKHLEWEAKRCKD